MSADQDAARVARTPQFPDQPLITDEHGTVWGLNELARLDFSADDWMQLAQLLGYSLSGYGDLNYVTDEAYERAEAQKP